MLGGNMNSLNAILAAFLLFSCYFPDGSCIQKLSHKVRCKAMLHILAAHQQDYVGCCTSKAVPVEFCTNCNNTYIVMQKAYKNITESKNCSKLFFEHDRINVVQTTQNMLIGLWEKAYCEDCHTNSSKKFYGYMDNLTSCFNQTKDDKKKCIACLNDYLDLNSFYISLDTQNKGRICYDMQDAMNQTRVKWSKELKCCHREFHMTLFLVSTICIGSLPIVFYVGAFILTKRRERNHAMLHISDPTNDVRPINGPILLPGTEDTEQIMEQITEEDSTVAGTQENTQIKLHKKVETESNSDDDDDDDNNYVPKMQKLIDL